MTSHAPESIAEAVLHLHRTLIGQVETVMSHAGFRIAVNLRDYRGGSLYYLRRL